MRAMIFNSGTLSHILIATAAILTVVVPVLADGEEEIVGTRNLLHGYPAINPDGTVNVVIECPAGTTAKWQVEPDGVLRRQYTDGEPLDIQYLPFLVNYGMIPHTLEPVEAGGEGEQLDIQVLGNAIERGTVVRAHVIGALAMLDRGSQDDKLLAVVDGSSLGTIRDIEELDERFPGISRIIETWWIYFKGKDVTRTFGFVGAKAATRHIRASAAEYDENPPAAVPKPR